MNHLYYPRKKNYKNLRSNASFSRQKRLLIKQNAFIFLNKNKRISLLNKINLFHVDINDKLSQLKSLFIRIYSLDKFFFIEAYLINFDQPTIIL